MKRDYSTFEMLLTVQWLGIISASVLAGLSLREYGFGGAIMPLSLCLTVALISWLVPQIVHELQEINDQLAGRSPEFHAHLKHQQIRADSGLP